MNNIDCSPTEQFCYTNFIDLLEEDPDKPMFLPYVKGVNEYLDKVRAPVIMLTCTHPNSCCSNSNTIFCYTTSQVLLYMKTSTSTGSQEALAIAPPDTAGATRHSVPAIRKDIGVQQNGSSSRADMQLFGHRGGSQYYQMGHKLLEEKM